MEGLKFSKSDVELCRAFQSIVKQGKFEIKGDAVTKCGGIFSWFMQIDKKIEFAILEQVKKEEPKKTKRKDLGTKDVF